MKSILVVDDHALVREPIEAILRSEGYSTRTACNGREAVLALTQSVPDLVFLDLTMPVMSGLQVLEHMRSTPRLKRVPVLVLTVAGERTKVISAAKLGVSGYVLKSSFSLDGLLQRVRDELSSEGPSDPRRHTKPSAANGTLTAGAEGSLSPVAGSGGGLGRDAGARGPAGSKPSVSDSARALQTLTPLITRRELFRRVAECADFKGLSPAVAHVLTLTANPRCSADAVAEAIGQDQAIALKILKLANSSVYTRGAQVDSVQKAVVRIGIDRIRQTVLNVSVVDRFSAVAFDEHLSSHQFWEHAIACGVIASEIARATREMDADAAFTIGLLHDVGRIVIAEQLGDDYVKVIAASRRLGLPLEEVETRMLGATHADVMSSVLESWHFPKDLSRAIVLHHTPLADVRAESHHGVAAVAVLALADRLAHALLLGSSGNDTLYSTGELCSALGIGAGVIARLKAVALEQTDAMKSAMLTQTTGVPWPRRLDQVRDSLVVPFRPLFVGAAPATDALAIYCAQLADPADAGAPNVAVVHLERPADRGEVAERLRVAEEELKVCKLPALVLSPDGRLALDEATESERRCERLQVPASIPLLIVALNKLGGVARAAA